jgi:outer membrane protein
MTFRKFMPPWRCRLLAFSLCLASFQCRGEDLSSVYREALLQDPIYEAAHYAFEAAEQKLPQARAGLLPTLSLSGSKLHQHGAASFNDAPEQNRDVRSYNLSWQLSQPLIRPANWAAYSQSEAQVRVAAAQLDLARQDLILRTVQAYFDVLLALESVAVAEGQYGAVEQQSILAKRNFEVGAATITDVHEAKARLDLARSQKISAANDLLIKRAELEKVTGRFVGRLTPLAADAALPAPLPADANVWAQQAANASPLVAIQDATVEALEHEVTRNRAAHAPTLDLNASRGPSYASGSMTSPEDIPTRSRASQVSIQLNIPIWSGGGTQARVAEAQANLAKARADREAARRQAVTAARQAYAGVINGQAQVDALASAEVSSQSAVEDNKVGYRIGTRINIDVLNAQQQLYTTRRDLARARVDALMQGLRLKAAVGTLDESDVMAVNRLLQP